MPLTSRPPRSACSTTSPTERRATTNVERGDVWLCSISMPETREDPFPNLRDKWVIPLQQSDLFPNFPQVAVVVASSVKVNRVAKTTAYNVFVGPDEIFSKAAVIDGRWVFTLPRARIEAGTLKGALSDTLMKQIDQAVAFGLDLVRPSSRPRPPVNP